MKDQLTKFVWMVIAEFVCCPKKKTKLIENEWDFNNKLILLGRKTVVFFCKPLNTFLFITSFIQKIEVIFLKLFSQFK